MKAIFAFVSIIILGFIAQLFLPWWVITIICFALGVTFIDKTLQAFTVGFFSVFLLWSALALVKSYQNDFILLNRMSEVLPLHNPGLLLLATGAIGGLIGMLSTASGYFLQTINDKPRRKY